MVLYIAYKVLRKSRDNFESLVPLFTLTRFRDGVHLHVAVAAADFKAAIREANSISHVGYQVMRVQRRPDLMTLLCWIAVTGVSLSLWSQARASESPNDIPESKLAAMGSASISHVILKEPRWMPE